MKTKPPNLLEKEDYPETIELPSEKRAMRKRIKEEMAYRIGLPVLGGGIPFIRLPSQPSPTHYTAMPKGYRETQED